MYVHELGFPVLQVDSKPGGPKQCAPACSNSKNLNNELERKCFSVDNNVSIIYIIGHHRHAPIISFLSPVHIRLHEQGMAVSTTTNVLSSKARDSFRSAFLYFSASFSSVLWTFIFIKHYQTKHPLAWGKFSPSEYSTILHLDTCCSSWTFLCSVSGMDSAK